MKQENPQYADQLIAKEITGIVIKYMIEKGFGFIRANNNEIKDDIFVYFNQIVPSTGDSSDSFLKLQQYQSVTFDLYLSRKGLLAKNVRGGEILVGLLQQRIKE